MSEESTTEYSQFSNDTDSDETQKTQGSSLQNELSDLNKAKEHLDKTTAEYAKTIQELKHKLDEGIRFNTDEIERMQTELQLAISHAQTLFYHSSKIYNEQSDSLLRSIDGLSKELADTKFQQQAENSRLKQSIAVTEQKSNHTNAHLRQQIENLEAEAQRLRAENTNEIARLDQQIQTQQHTSTNTIKRLREETDKTIAQISKYAPYMQTHRHIPRAEAHSLQEAKDTPGTTGLILHPTPNTPKRSIPSEDSLLAYHERAQSRFSIVTVILIAIETLKCIEALHKQGIVSLPIHSSPSSHPSFPLRFTETSNQMLSR